MAKKDQIRVFSNLAVSLDGKIADPRFPNRGLGSSEDKKLMNTLRSQSDVVIFGAETLRVLGRCVKHRGPNRVRPGSLPANAIVTRTGRLENLERFWEDPNVLKFVFTTEKAEDKVRKIAQDRAFVVTCGQENVEAGQVVAYLKKCGFKNLLVEGGGEIIRLFLESGDLGELFVTHTPWIIGGQSSPSLVGGEHALSPWLRFELKSFKKIGSEIYARYLVKNFARKPSKRKTK